ncbi:MAG: HIT domain-containing protein [Cellulomonadaceae bacterium]|jgi:ATP adenylyltransferase|nr:HIT domain-containing protein [Cellulomonadaceae bacterium]
MSDVNAPVPSEVPHAAYEPEDAMGRLWVPHRMVYIRGEKKPADSSKNACPFCELDPAEDSDNLVVARGADCFCILNLFPYNSGHLMVLPYRHVAAYVDLTDAETVELAAMTKKAIRTLTAVFGPQGFNLGINQGDVAGAGIGAHLHQHVVPRWNGDANFLPIVGHTKAMPELLADTHQRLSAAWPGLS